MAGDHCRMIRTRPRRALDPRLVLGILLVVGSVAGVVALVSATSTTTPVLAAARPLAPGEVISADDVEVVDVRLGASSDGYLAELPAGVVATRVVGEGELIPVDAVGSGDGVRLAAVVLAVDGDLAEAVAPGALVDVWAARAQEGGGFGPPAVIASGATVVRLVASESVVTGGRTTGVEVLVPRPRLARVLEAVANADAVSLVPLAIPVG